EVGQAFAEALLEFCLERIVVCVIYVVAIETDSCELWKRFYQLRPCNRRITQRGRTRNLPKIRVWDAIQQRRADGKLIHSQLVYAYIRHAYVCDLRSGIRHFDHQ